MFYWILHHATSISSYKLLLFSHSKVTSNIGIVNSNVHDFLEAVLNVVMDMTLGRHGLAEVNRIGKWYKLIVLQGSLGSLMWRVNMKNRG